MNFSDFSCCINKLKNKQYGLEKYEADFIKCIKKNYDINVQEEYNQIKMLRDQEFYEIRKDIRHNLKSLKCLKSLVISENVETLDLPTLRGNMLSLENNIQNSKLQINTELENLTKTENVLNIEIINTEMKLAEINKQIMEKNKNAIQLTQCILVDDNIYQEVKDFTIFLTKSSGHEGGWPKEDHLIFLKMYNKHKNMNKIITEVHKFLPDKSNDDIESHIKWYKTYLELRNKQKDAIEKWKKSKYNKGDKRDGQKQSDNREKIKIIEKRPESDSEVKEKLKQWKLEKDKKLQQHLDWQEQSLAKMKELEKQKRLKQVEMKKEIQEWKCVKSVQERADKLEKEINSLKEKERKISLANKLIREYQSQDNLFLSKRLSKLRISEPNISLKHKRSKVSRDPERIYKATKQWISRITSEEFGLENNMFARNLPLRKIPKLAVPEWRKTIPQN